MFLILLFALISAGDGLVKTPKAILRKEFHRLSKRPGTEVGFPLPSALIEVRSPFYTSPFFTTNAIYNGSFTGNYMGLYAACNRERSGSYPCRPDLLLHYGFWLSNLVPSWVLTLVNNCVGFTSHDQDSMGMCIETGFPGKQLIQCSCDMNISVCCYGPPT